MTVAAVGAAGAAALSGSPSGTTKMDMWDVDDASQIAVQPVLLNKQVRGAMTAPQNKKPYHCTTISNDQGLR